MRRKVIAGNWKMNNDLQQSISLVKEIKNLLTHKNINCDVVICPPFTSLNEVKNLIEGGIIKLGAQNMFYEDSGAFTGEISAPMLKSVGCEYVILGHSERRTIFGEKDEMINKKVRKALSHQLKPILCVGETLEEREKDITEKVVKRQIEKGLTDITPDEILNVIIAYEPVWAIGTGKTATPQQAQEVHQFIRKLLTSMYSKDFAQLIPIQYGGSVKPENAKELLSQNDIDGALVGGACLKADSFIGIVEAA
jgi:triosephosphate isomerase